MMAAYSERCIIHQGGTVQDKNLLRLPCDHGHAEFASRCAHLPPARFPFSGRSRPGVVDETEATIRHAPPAALRYKLMAPRDCFRAGAYRGKRGAYRRVGSFPDHFAESFPEQQSGAPAGQKYVSYDTRVAELPFRLS